ncbi:MAG: signal recognition particle-docking protein FtsY [SAR202 cluster bacterium]|nr:signal recognition particle-docking protein FtsY [Chloroflexota bacterium]MQG51453.1 signal recognition particle-docking protein FtsY [SAR202 cluster bacterium]|tara:strand:+ start:7825 stop:8760 length:936 start_codon:yes stop_codon:yes gene_type:complete
MNNNNPYNTALTITKSSFFERVKSIFSKRIDYTEKLDLIEEILITSDVGIQTTEIVIKHLQEALKHNPELDLFNESKAVLFDLLIDNPIHDQINLLSEIKNTTPFIILVSGVNGVGKTTTVAKLAAMFSRLNLKVVIGACDSFRAGAVEQIENWGAKLNIRVISNKTTKDPASVAFDTVNSAISNQDDIVLLDTAGRLQNDTNLMGELEKISNITKRFIPESPHLSLLIMDATVGQNGIEQAKQFTNSAKCDSVILTKLDTSAKGGIVLRIYQELNLPILFVGTGEKIEDLENFNKEDFLNAFFSYDYQDV